MAIGLCSPKLKEAKSDSVLKMKGDGIVQNVYVDGRVLDFFRRQGKERGWGIESNGVGNGQQMSQSWIRDEEVVERRQGGMCYLPLQGGMFSIKVLHIICKYPLVTRWAKGWWLPIWIRSPTMLSKLNWEWTFYPWKEKSLFGRKEPKMAAARSDDILNSCT